MYAFRTDFLETKYRDGQHNLKRGVQSKSINLFQNQFMEHRTCGNDAAVVQPPAPSLVSVVSEDPAQRDLFYKEPRCHEHNSFGEHAIARLDGNISRYFTPST